MIPALLGNIFAGAAGAGGAGIGSSIGQMIPGVLGSILGGFGSQSSQTRQMAGPSATGIAGEQAVLENLKRLQEYANLGPGAEDVSQGLTSQRDLASMLQSFSQGGFLPGQQDWQTASQFSSRAFQPQEVALNQAFQQNQQRTAQLAAQLGRPVNDPILQAKLSQERSQGMERLGASRSAYESEFAQNLPMQRLGFMGQLADVRGQLSNQANSNRQSILGIGRGLLQDDRQFRLASSGMNQQQGGGAGGSMAGFMAKAPSFFQGLSGLFNQGNAAQAQPNYAEDTSGTGYDPFGPNTMTSRVKTPSFGRQVASPMQGGYNPANFPNFANQQPINPFSIYNVGMAPNFGGR
jgi:hypothetical protein